MTFVDSVPVFKKLRIGLEFRRNQACLDCLDAGIFCRIIGFNQFILQEHTHPAMPHKGLEIIFQLLGTSIMTSRHVLGIIFLIFENRRKRKTFMCFYQGKFGFDIVFYELRNFKLILFFCICREKGLVNRTIIVF